jgi:hypothetical protein
VTIEILPQPRVDTLVTDAAGGGQRRRTEYTGTAWFDGRAEAAGMTLRRIGPPGVSMQSKDVAIFVPDSLPYRREGLEGAQLSVTAALQASGEQGVILSAEAAFVDDPSGTPTWVQLHIAAYAHWPFAVVYRVVALTAPDAVAA